MIKSLYCLILSTTLCGCLSMQKDTRTGHMIEISSRGEFFNRSVDKVADLSKSVEMYDDGRDIFYMVSLIKTESRMHESKKNDQRAVGDTTIYYEEELLSMDTVYTLYVLKKGNERGLKYPFENFGNETGHLFHIDSLLEYIHLAEPDLTYFSADLGQPVQVEKNGDKMVEKFLIAKQSIAEPDSIYRFYDKRLAPFSFSFSKTFDAKNRSKLCETRYIFNEIPKGVIYHMAIPKRVNYYKMQLVESLDKKTIDSILHKFDGDWEKNPLAKKE